MKIMKQDYELLDHTADIGVRVQAPDLETLFTKAAYAMFDIMAVKHHRSDGRPVETFVELKSDNSNELLLDWLNELISLGDARCLIFTDFAISELSANFLKAEVKGLSKEYFDIERDIKAVTAHHLNIQQTKKGLEVEIIFDV